ncbi:hypothetical protein CsSME_00044601 [Camellia sinensis var. sinensis]|uniref:Uncharacterized protein n=1 Tax=Camellia sinensis var. sinensis TaxID=542762 RepID=A0A4S4E4S6_CAMSN|nr:hypothetical protein TEA_012532 [Camellia sinensis var. sinensis]
MYVDVRYLVPLGINMLKSHASWPWDWDPFNMLTIPNWPKLGLFFFLFFLFPFAAVEVVVTCPSNARHIRFRLRNFSVTLVVTVASSLLLPQVVFWYAYPIIVLLCLWYAWLANVFVSFLCWVQAMLSTVPILNIMITTTCTNEVHLEGTVRPSLANADAQVTEEGPV